MWAAEETDFCPDEEDRENAIEQAPPGCELIIRAYNLGYSKDLGDCAPKGVENEEEEICRKRQKDEPFIHYTWRQLGMIYENYVNWSQDNSIDKQVNDFNEKTGRLGQIFSNTVHSMTASPHSMHHIFTNIPEPEKTWKEKFEELTQKNLCLSKFSTQKNTIDYSGESGLGRSLEFAYSHLLFNNTDQASAAFCREFKIHWGQDKDIRKILAKDLKGELDDRGIWSDLEEILSRRDSLNPTEDLAELKKRQLNRFASFQCLIFSDASEEVTSQKTGS